jgi:hypothetical protein
MECHDGILRGHASGVAVESPRVYDASPCVTL